MHQKKNHGEPVRHTFKLLSNVPDLVHGVFTRHGGVSNPPYHTLNVAWNNGDLRGAVQENLVRVKQSLGLDQLVAAPQVHGDTIHVMDERALAAAQDHFPVRLAPQGDGLVTALRGVGLLIKIADCQAVFLVDPIRKVIANIHCGWRGTVKGLTLKAVGILQERFGCRPEDILATVSPSLGPCCAEFRNYRDELPPSFWSYQIKPHYFDFWAISRAQLVSVGLLPQNIEIARRCTVCESHDFFSYRGEGATGRLAAVVGWKDTPGSLQGN